MNYGYIHSAPPASARMFGGVDRTVLVEDQSWRNFLPIYETQVGNGFDSMSCVSFSALNALETLFKRKYGREINLSDRFTSKMSGTTRYGNTFYNVSNSLCEKHGFVQEERWPKGGTTFDEYQSPIPSEIVSEGLKAYDEHEISSEFVPLYPDALCEALKYGPLQVSGHAWNKPKNGVYQRTSEQGNHAFLLFEAEYGKSWTIYDHYDQDGNAFKKLAWDYLFWGAMLYDITLKSMSNVKILKDKNSKSVGFWIPATSEAALDSMSYALGSPLEKKADGSIDWDKSINGEFELK